MKNCALLLVLSLGACASYAPLSSGAYFHSWYNGYFEHTVWGLGQVTSSNNEAYVICGDEHIPVKPVFDTHMYAGYDPKTGQTQEEATAHNENLLAKFAERGVTCRLPKADAVTPN